MNNSESLNKKYFTKETLEFLRNLKENNNKEWFEENKSYYEKYVLEPFKYLVKSMDIGMLAIDSNFEVKPSVNRTISRIQRDTRFSKDKAPYKSTVWVTFKVTSKDWKEKPSFFFELSPDSYRFGMGFYSASKDTMDKFRELIDRDTKKFLKAVDFFYSQDTFALEGDKYKRIIDSTKSEKVLDWYQRKNLYLVSNRKIDDLLFSESLAATLVEEFDKISDFYHYLRGIG